MADFDWNEHPIAEPSDKKEESFDWGQHEVVSNEPSLSEPSQLEAMARGAAKGATFGFSDRAEAGIESALGMGDYESLLKSIRDKNKLAEATHPYSYMGGQIAGGIGSTLLGGAALGGGSKLLGLAGLGRTAAGTAEAASGLAEAGELAVHAKKIGALKDIANTAKAGAIGGAATGVGESEDLTKVPDVAKSAVSGATTGAVGGAALHTTGKGLSSLASLAKETFGSSPYEKAVKYGFKAGISGRPLSGASQEAVAEANKVASSGVLDNVKKIRTDLSNQYDEIIDSSPSTFSKDTLGSIFDKVAAKNVEESSGIRENELLKMQTIVQRIIAGSEDGNITPRQLDNGIKLITKYVDSAVEKNDVDMIAVAKPLRDSFKNLLDFELEKTAGSEVMRDLRNKSLRLNKLEDMFGINKNIGGSESEIQALETGKDVFNKFLKAEDSSQAAVDLDSVFNEFSGLSKDVLGRDVAQPLRTELKQKAEDYVLSRMATKTDLTSGQSRLGFSSKALATRVGRAAGTAVKGAKDIAYDFPIAVTKDLTNKVINDVPGVGALADKLVGSAEPSMQKAGEMLHKVIIEPEVSRRKALMFSLSQQPWFRESVAKTMSNKEEPGE